MSNIDTTKGDIHPNSTPSTTTGPDDKRVREGTAARRELGRFAVMGERHEILSAGCELEPLARFLGVLADEERVEPPAWRGWRHYIGRNEAVVVNGVSVVYARPITQTYTTEAAARRAVEHLVDREGLVICSFDTSRREGVK